LVPTFAGGVTDLLPQKLPQKGDDVTRVYAMLRRSFEMLEQMSDALQLPVAALFTFDK
jgi:hypothetical protein